jgi:hypothetical protein
LRAALGRSSCGRLLWLLCRTLHLAAALLLASVSVGQYQCQSNAAAAVELVLVAVVLVVEPTGMVVCWCHTVTYIRTMLALLAAAVQCATDSRHVSA